MPTIVSGPRVLFTGANGSVTAGVTVRSSMSEAECKARGYLYEFAVNTFSLAKATPESFDEGSITAGALADLVEQCRALESTPSPTPVPYRGVMR